MSMWNEAQEGIAKQKKGAELTYVEKHRARMDHPIPDNIGCQYASEVMSPSVQFFFSFSHFVVLLELLVKLLVSSFDLLNDWRNDYLNQCSL